MELPCVHLRENSKLPHGKHWEVSCDPQDHARWISKGHNIALKTGEIEVADFDDKAEARKFFANHKDILRVIVESRRGIHYWFKGPGPNRKFKHGDLKGDGGYVLIPPSSVDGWVYRYVPGFDISRVDDLQPFPSELFPELNEVNQGQKIVRGIVNNVRGYLARIEAIKHKGNGYAAGLTRACAVLRDAGVSPQDAMAELVIWNQGPNVFPKYPVHELARAVTNVYSKGGK